MSLSFSICPFVLVRVGAPGGGAGGPGLVGGGALAGSLRDRTRGWGWLMAKGFDDMDGVMARSSGFVIPSPSGGPAAAVPVSRTGSAAAGSAGGGWDDCQGGGFVRWVRVLVLGGAAGASHRPAGPGPRGPSPGSA